MSKKLRDYQLKVKADIYNAWDEGHRNILLTLPTGLGKCLGKNVPVLMFNGSIKMSQDIVKSDLIMGPDSKPRKVLSTNCGKSKMFKIIPTKGEPWTCNDVHVLTLTETESGKIIDIPLNDYLKKSKWFKHIYKQFRVAVDFPLVKITFDPYLLGIYLAEGNYRAPRLTNPDKEVIEYLKIWGEKNEMKNKIRNLAKSCTNKDDRWIPKEFLINSREIRLKVLAGLLDGDGHLAHSGFQIITKYTSLNRDILFLARSLGFSAYSAKVKKSIKSRNFTGEYFQITIFGNTNEIPTLIKRKQAEPRKQIKNVLRTGFEVVPLPEGDYYGFTLNGDGRFLLGDFTVTHNTVCFCSIAIDKAINEGLPTAIMVHRKELLSQISLTLAQEGITHNIIAPRPVILGIVAAHRRLLKKQFYDYSAPITVLSVDTLNARILKHEAWAKSIKFWITDEAAHLLKDNKWGRAIAYFINATIGLGVTATPKRLDKKGLGAHVDGVFHYMVEGPNTRWGIDNGFLSKYKIAIPESDYRDYLKESTSGADYTKEAMADASAKSQITGDVVTNYKKFADGKQAIVFASDIASAERMETNFIKAGISAKLLTGVTEDGERLNAMINFRDKKIQVLINVDLFDEGLDVVGIECVIMARPSKSLGKVLQQIGRGLRVAEGKPHLIIIDHVGNIKEHGLPCAKRKWSLDRPSKRKKKTNLVRICSNWKCMAPYDRYLTKCPYCGAEDKPKEAGESTGRVPPEQVDGDLVLLDPETLRDLEKSVTLEAPESVAARVEMVAGHLAGLRALKNQKERIETQKKLAETIARWAGNLKEEGLNDREIHKRFFIEQKETINGVLSKPKAEMLDTIKDLEDL